MTCVHLAAPPLYLCPISFAEAAAFVARHHRHRPAPVGHKFSIAEAQDNEIVGVVMVGRPVARSFDDCWTLEVTRTYTLASESGASLRGAGWRVVAQRRPRVGWNMPGCPRVDTTVHGVQRTLWEAT